MNNLTTRKIVLGMLMALVLAFSVQGTADALPGSQEARATFNYMHRAKTLRYHLA